MSRDPQYLLVSCADLDMGVLPANEACQAALEHAQETGKRVQLRDAITDAIVATVRPTGRRHQRAA